MSAIFRSVLSQSRLWSIRGFRTTTSVNSKVMKVAILGAAGRTGATIKSCWAMKRILFFIRSANLFNSLDRKMFSSAFKTVKHRRRASALRRLAHGKSRPGTQPHRHWMQSGRLLGLFEYSRGSRKRENRFNYRRTTGQIQTTRSPDAKEQCERLEWFDSSRHWAFSQSKCLL